MISINIKHLMQAIRDADSFVLPQMNAGAKYLYERMYSRLACGETVHLSEIDFGHFEYDDISAISTLHENVFGQHETMAGKITAELKKIPPSINSVVYI